METKIRVLPAEVAGKIAAGEVIERPASVVKELVENALDAQGRVITVEIEEGGKRSIAVMDDGEGMAQSDALLALERHATSKIYDEGDLAAIRTLGFRGEALPSIAAVSRLRLITRRHDALSGTQVVVEGGDMQGVEEIGSPPGTRVEAADLFYNLPARRKFLRGAQSELAHIIEVITRQALVDSSVGFALKHNRRVLFNLPPTTDERARIRAILGKEVVSRLVRVQGAYGLGELRGWATLPDYCRGTAKGIYIYVNGRYIRDKLISHAIAEAYRGVIAAKMYPVVILFISVPLSEVDVNCHPAKMEVRFKKGADIHRLVHDALKSALANPREARLNEVSEIKEEIAAYSAVPSRSAAFEMIASPSWRMVGQIKGTYLVVEGDEGVMIIDQHAAHERILYERLKNALHGGRVSQQPFLIPQPIELTREEKELLIANSTALARVGLELEEFGERSVVVQAIPAFLQGEDLRALLEALSEELVERGEGDTVEHCLDRICMLFACRGAIKANQRVQEEEVKSLLAQWEAGAQPTTCPHGRPLLVKWGWREFERWFRRG
ncbi:MAG TPA: DNA mismatch repair endonuclease MutL [Thermodesulfobacteriota bacterium]|jgi:DNA mismatch repair protein MutL